MSTPTYNPFIPQPPDLPSDSQPDMDSNFLRLNQVFGVDHIPMGNLIEAATLASPAVLTSTNHRLVTGNTVTVFNMEGINDLGVREEWPINGLSFTVTVIDENTFSLDASNSTTYPPYLADSGDFSSAQLLYGWHLKTFLNNTQDSPPNRTRPRSAYFTQDIENLAQFFYQNGPTAADVLQLTNIEEFIQTDTGWGFKTPWGFIINMGQVVAPTDAFKRYNFPLPFPTNAFSITASKGNIRQQTGGGSKSISCLIFNNSQFDIRYSQNSGGDGSAYVSYLAIGL